MSIIIRHAKMDDAPHLLKAQQEIAQEPGYFCSQPSELNEQNIKTAIESTQGICLVAEKEGKIIGHAFLKALHLQSLCHVAELTIVVNNGHQEQGVGTKLLGRIIEWAKQSSNIEKIELNVRASNLRAIALYKKMGFCQEGLLKKRVKIAEHYIDDSIMALWVK